MTEPWSVSYDTARWLEREGPSSLPRPAFPHRPRPGDRRAALRAALSPRIAAIVRSSPHFTHPFLVPGASYHQLWTWDAYFTGLAVQDEHPAAFAGSLTNLLDAVTGEGRPASLIDPDGVPSYDYVPQPVHAQWALSLVRGARVGSAWLPASWPVLLRLRRWWDENCLSRHHLYTWVDGGGSGIDNDRAIYARAVGDVALVDMNCFHVRELRAMSHLARLLDDGSESTWREAADELSCSINDYMWDPVDRTYFHLHLAERTGATLQQVTWELPYKTQSWGCLFPLWTGVADPGRADALVRTQVLEPRQFLSGFGIRSAPTQDRMYNNASMADPSNWQGPVWGLSTMLTCYGLARYGYVAEAIRIASRFVDLLVADLEANDCIHEFYDAETGRPGFNPGFLSWNLLALRVLDDLESGVDPTDID